jgi:hypothetical protein
MDDRKTDILAVGGGPGGFIGVEFAEEIQSMNRHGAIMVESFQRTLTTLLSSPRGTARKNRISLPAGKAAHCSPLKQLPRRELRA